MVKIRLINQGFFFFLNESKERDIFGKFFKCNSNEKPYYYRCFCWASQFYLCITTPPPSKEASGWAVLQVTRVSLPWPSPNNTESSEPTNMIYVSIRSPIYLWFLSSKPAFARSTKFSDLWKNWSTNTISDLCVPDSRVGKKTFAEGGERPARRPRTASPLGKKTRQKCWGGRRDAPLLRMCTLLLRPTHVQFHLFLGSSSNTSKQRRERKGRSQHTKGERKDTAGVGGTLLPAVLGRLCPLLGQPAPCLALDLPSQETSHCSTLAQTLTEFFPSRTEAKTPGSARTRGQAVPALGSCQSSRQWRKRGPQCNHRHRLVLCQGQTHKEEDRIKQKGNVCLKEEKRNCH